MWDESICVLDSSREDVSLDSYNYFRFISITDNKLCSLSSIRVSCPHCIRLGEDVRKWEYGNNDDTLHWTKVKISVGCVWVRRSHRQLSTNLVNCSPTNFLPSHAVSIIVDLCWENFSPLPGPHYQLNPPWACQQLSISWVHFSD